MPELSEDMYCSQQICIPPTFPYLLRQYAKAAIRTQPSDLLRWSTAYFRCLALNLPPPVKPRLEYPIPRTHFGLTPGWLKALVLQLSNNLTVPFKVLWDRWIGACLQHANLVEVLCLGGFTDPHAIPWYRFVALCAAHLTDNLTQTMILVCEVLTEEPEGGSAMIPLETFTDLYRFLAAIDASQPQTLHNLYFTDSLLSLYREPSIAETKETASVEEEEAPEESVEAEEVKEEVVEQGPVEDQIGVVISCPDIGPDDYKREEDFALTELNLTEKLKDTEKLDKPLKNEPPEAAESTSADDSKVAEADDSKAADAGDSKAVQAGDFKAAEAGKEQKRAEETPKQIGKTPVEPGFKSKESVDTLIGYMPPREHTERELEEDLERLRQAQKEEEAMGEEEEAVTQERDMETLKKMLEGPPGLVEPEAFESEKSVKEEEEMEEGAEEETEALDKDLVYVDAIPGIGPIVPDELVEAVVKYMKACAENQHGMVMPRNVRHYNCPPLEVYQ